jgi:hypothetical protein
MDPMLLAVRGGLIMLVEIEMMGTQSLNEPVVFTKPHKPAH